MDVPDSGDQAFALAAAAFKPWRTNPPEHERWLAHPPDEPQNFERLLRKAPPHFRERKEFEYLGIVVEPEPVVAVDQVLGLGHGPEARLIGDFERPIEMADQEFGCGHCL